MVQNNINILDYIVQRSGSKLQKQGNKVLLNPCPICGHRDHFFIYPKTNSYYSFSGCCKGGSLVDWLMEFEGLSLPEAMARVYGDSPPSDIRGNKEIDELAKLLNKKVESFFHVIVGKYRLMVCTEEAFKRLDIPWTNPFYRWIRQGVRFYDGVTTQFIEGDYSERVKLMRNHKDEYFFKLCPEVDAIEQ